MWKYDGSERSTNSFANDEIMFTRVTVTVVTVKN